MHEISIVQALIEQVQQEVSRSGHAGRVLRLELVIGRLSGVNADAIRFAFEVLSPGTLVEGAQLDIAQPKAACCCHACGAQTAIDELPAECPQCGSRQVSIEAGRELLLQSIELQEEEPGTGLAGHQAPRNNTL